MAILSGGPFRPTMTAKAIKQINLQSFASIQKIFINAGRNSAQISQVCDIYGEASSLEKWQIIEVENLFEKEKKLSSVWFKPGIELMKHVTGEYLFAQNDDDFVDENFFEIMYQEMIKNQNTVTAIGLQKKWYWETASITEPEPGEWENRPVAAPGFHVFNEIVYKNNHS